MPLVTALPGIWIQRDLGEEGNVHAFRLPLSPAVTEEVILGAKITLKPGHVFNEAEDPHIYLGEHADSFPRVYQGNLLGSGHYYGAVKGDGLNNSQLDVASSGREIQDEDIKITLGDLLKKLLDIAGGKRTTHNNRRAVAKKKTHRHKPDTVGLDRDDPLLLIGHGLLVGHAKHECD